jgi:hypothetical protein
MAEYKGIKGFKVQTVSTDPAASAIAGGTWASGGDLNTARELWVMVWELKQRQLYVAGVHLTYFANKNTMELLGQNQVI